jgi:hypothetical protein
VEGWPPKQGVSPFGRSRTRMARLCALRLDSPNGAHTATRIRRGQAKPCFSLRWGITARFARQSSKEVQATSRGSPAGSCLLARRLGAWLDAWVC